MLKADCQIFVTIMITVINCLIIDQREEHVKALARLKRECLWTEQGVSEVRPKQTNGCSLLGLHPF
jgi:hypothetical protein